MKKNITEILASEINALPQQVAATISLLDAGDTVPFIARYRKEVTGGLDDTQLRLLHNRLNYLRELNDRKKTILTSIEEQGKLDESLRCKIEATLLKNELEELYLPYRPKRRTRGQIAIEAGLEPLAELLWKNRELDPENIANQYLNPSKEITTAKIALDGAKYILIERLAEDAEILSNVRDYMKKNAYIVSRVIEGQEQNGAKFKDYFLYNEKISQIPSHRALALFRGRKEGILRLVLTDQPDLDLLVPEHYCETIIANQLKLTFEEDNAATRWKKSIINWTWKVKLALYVETELFTELRERAEIQAVGVFAKNINDLLMSAPAGMKVTMGLDPGIRTGVKVAVIDCTGKLLETETIYPYTGQLERALITLAKLCQKYTIELIAIGNGTASRETVQLFQTLKQQYPNIIAKNIVVSEAGASVYSASELAAIEFPDLDVSLRGAVSIARRLQDPLAELVKIEPKSIGVGQYQHDINQSLLSKELNNIVESCVNSVGVDLNTASVPLLMRVSGLNQSIAQNIVQWRDEHGRFNDRRELLEVPRLGKKAYQQCAGFLRISLGTNPLDASGVHPETYSIVNKILDNTQQSIQNIIGNSSLLMKLNPKDYVDNLFGLPTITDIIKELDKPGRDPRPEFKMAQFSDNIFNIEDLTQGMIMEGVVTNVTNFGAFVDIGVHQDGLIHISALSDKFVQNAQDIIKAGDIIKVRVMDIDIARKRIALSTQLNDHTFENKKQKSSTINNTKKSHSTPAQTGTFGNALLAAFKKTK